MREREWDRERRGRERKGEREGRGKRGRERRLSDKLTEGDEEGEGD